jgi:ligand-binding SRPBCC domain-containing protein
MKFYRLEEAQQLPVSIEEAWDFFSNPRNLDAITPAWLKFKIVSDVPEKMIPGLIILYRIQILPGIPSTWVTEITHVREPFFFVDEPRFGPYRFWHHRHQFHEVESGTEVRDILHYVLPFGVLGRLAHLVKIRSQLREIFAFRRAALTERFGAPVA